MTGALSAVLRRDLRLALRNAADTAAAALFFVLVAALVPLGVGPAPEILARIAPGMLWVAALLSTLLSLDRMFRLDHEDGTLDLLATAPPPLALLVLAKAAAHWLACGLPLVLIAPLLALLLQVPSHGLVMAAVGMALGTPTLCLLGSIGAALVLGARRGGVLLPLLVLPLYIPVLVLGVTALDAAIAGLPVRPHLMLLGALLLAALTLCPLAAAAALRQALR